MKLELKHLAPYLPYGLGVNLNRNNGMFKASHVNLHYVSIHFNSAVNETYFKYKNVTYGLYDCKPILRPLSDYVDINETGYTDLNCDLMDQLIINELANKTIPLSLIPFGVIQIMSEHHIDFFNLIPDGLAINKLEL